MFLKKKTASLHFLPLLAPRSGAQWAACANTYIRIDRVRRKTHIHTLLRALINTEAHTQNG